MNRCLSLKQLTLVPLSLTVPKDSLFANELYSFSTINMPKSNSKFHLKQQWEHLSLGPFILGNSKGTERELKTENKRLLILNGWIWFSILFNGNSPMSLQFPASTEKVLKVTINRVGLSFKHAFFLNKNS